MSNESEMNVPVTRGEMHQAFETWAKVIVDGLTASLTTVVTAKIAESEQRLMSEIGRATAASEKRLMGEIGRATEASEQRLMIEIGRATAASAEKLKLEWRDEIAQFVKVVTDTNRTEIRVVDDRYGSLPERVERLEDAVFKPKPKRRAKG